MGSHTQSLAITFLQDDLMNRAASIILENAIRGMELLDLAARPERLENEHKPN